MFKYKRPNVYLVEEMNDAMEITFRNVELNIGKFLRLESVKILLRDEKPRKIVLYGPNAAGKSSILYTLCLLMDEAFFSKILGIRDFGRYINNSKFIIKSEDEILIGVENGEYVCGNTRSISYWAVRECILRTFEEKLEISTVSYLRGDKVYHGTIGELREELDLWDPESWEALLEDPEEIEKVLGDWRTYAEIMNVYPNKVKVFVNSNAEWIDIPLHAYGLRKAMALTYFTKFSDLLLIENFENGLHLDLIVDLMRWLTGNAKYVILETHHGIVVRHALNLGWDVYYVSDGKAYKASREDLSNIDLYRRELEFYVLR